MAEKACRKCMRIIFTPDASRRKSKKGEAAVDEKPPVCELCNSSDLSDEWSGLLIILDPKKSEISQKVGAEIPGNYALRVR